MKEQPFKKLHQTLENAQVRIGESGKDAEGATGTIAWVRDGVIAVERMPGARMGEFVRIVDAEVSAIVLQLDGDKAFAALLENSDLVRPGNKVARTKAVASIGVSEEILGRVVDPLGSPLDNLGAVPAKETMLLENPAPSVMDRQPVSTPVQTGILAIDSLIPIGRGQRELIIGDRQTGKTTIALDTIINQKGQNMICVYVAIGQRDSKIAQVIKTLEQNQAMAYTVVVVASSSQQAAMQYLAPYAGAAIAEFFMKQGRDVLVVYDDLSKHAVAYRELSLLLRKPPGREAYPGDVFYIHSRLLERAARLSEEKGGGSMTALPIIETQAADVSAYIPTNVISITDGQIFLEPKLFYKGIRPAINVGISVSRVGGSAQTKAMKKVSGQTKLYLAQYNDLAAFSQFASELDEESKRQLTRGERLVEVMKQSPTKPYELWQEVVLLYTAMNGYLDSVPLPEAGAKIALLLEQSGAHLKEEIAKLRQKPELTEEIEQKIKAFVERQFPA